MNATITVFVDGQFHSEVTLAGDDLTMARVAEVAQEEVSECGDVVSEVEILIIY